MKREESIEEVGGLWIEWKGRGGRRMDGMAVSKKKKEEKEERKKERRKDVKDRVFKEKKWRDKRSRGENGGKMMPYSFGIRG